MEPHTLDDRVHVAREKGGGGSGAKHSSKVQEKQCARARVRACVHAHVCVSICVCVYVCTPEYVYVFLRRSCALTFAHWVTSLHLKHRWWLDCDEPCGGNMTGLLYNNGKWQVTALSPPPPPPPPAEELFGRPLESASCDSYADGHAMSMTSSLCRPASFVGSAYPHMVDRMVWEASAQPGMPYAPPKLFVEPLSARSSRRLREREREDTAVLLNTTPVR